MSKLVREHPESVCQPDGAHHPHMFICDDPDCECEDDLEDGRGWMAYHILLCCIDGQDWPCATKRGHVNERKKRHLDG